MNRKTPYRIAGSLVLAVTLIATTTTSANASVICSLTNLSASYQTGPTLSLQNASSSTINMSAGGTNSTLDIPSGDFAPHLLVTRNGTNDYTVTAQQSNNSTNDFQVYSGYGASMYIAAAFTSTSVTYAGGVLTIAGDLTNTSDYYSPAILYNTNDGGSTFTFDGTPTLNVANRTAYKKGTLTITMPIDNPTNYNNLDDLFNNAYFTSSGGSVTASISPVPEPASLMLLGLGGLALIGRYRRRIA